MAPDSLADSDNDKQPAERAGAREWLGLGVIAIPCLLYSMDLTVLNLASPHISADLRPSGVQLLWIVDVYGFLIAGSLITMGTLGDRIGRRKLLLIGAAAFGLASVIAAFSTSAAMLIAARAVLGVAAATLAPSTLSLIRNMFLDPKERTRAIGVWVASFSLGAAIGPVIGGLLLTHFWWGSVFLINVPLMLLLLVLGPFLLPEFRDPNAGRLDIISAVMSVGAVLLIIFGIKRFAETGALAAAAPACVAGLALGWLFLRRQTKLDHPLIDLTLFRSFAFSAALVLGVVAFFVNFGVFLFLAQYLQLALGLSPFEAGLWTVPSALGFIAGSLVAPRIVARSSPSRVMAGGFLIAAIGLAVLTQIDSPRALAIIVGGGTLLSFGLAPVILLSTDLIVGAAPPERAGGAAALSETAAELGGALGIALLGSVVTAVYRAGTANLASSDIPAAAATAARDTLGAATAVAQTLPTDLGAQVFEIARAAFTAGVQTGTAVSALLAAAAGVLALIALRAAPAPHQQA
jgi:MFS transporter, DHA2 family, multidrug resistance protein